MVDPRPKGHTPDDSRGTSPRVEEAREQAREAGQRLKDAAAQRVEQEFDKRSNAASRQADETAHALQESAERFRAHDQASLAHLAEEGADMLARLSGSLREKSFEELSSDLQHEARRHPALFIAGAVGVGFAMSRFLRASSHRRRRHFDDDLYDDYGDDEALHAHDPYRTSADSDAADQPGAGARATPTPPRTETPAGRPTGYGTTPTGYGQTGTTSRPAQGPGGAPSASKPT